MRRMTITLWVLMLTLLLLPGTAGAYAYGDPNEEVIANNLRDIAVKLDANPPDWNGAGEIYKVSRSELAAHFGEDIVQELDANIQAKNAQLLLSNFKGVLIMNLERRFTYAEQGIKDYGQAKLLLAKAKGTYEILLPYSKDKLKPEQIAQINTAFDEALNALGNPGLFGVGEKAANPVEFKKQTSFILNTLSPLFPFKGKAGNGPTLAPGGNGNEAPVQHAPMIRTDKTNPIVSVAVIGGILIIVVGAFVYARRKGLF